MRRAALALALAACPGPAAPALCPEVCELLTLDCGYAAFPDPTSCEQGCRYEIEEGADVRSLYSCLSEAGCDTPAVLACSRAYGGAP